jgi:hypothetical protein
MNLSMNLNMNLSMNLNMKMDLKSHEIFDFTSCVLQVSLFNGGESSHDNELEQEVGEGAQDDKVVQPELPLGHLSTPPERNPVKHPKQIAQKR